jgi:phage terminase small subunit
MTPKQERFVEEYICDLNATQAAIRAGYAAGSADVEGVRLLGNASVAIAIQDAKKARSERTAITADRVAREFAKVGRSDVRKLFTREGALKPIHEMDDDTAASISSIEVVTRSIPGADGEPARVEYSHKIRTYDKITALTQLARHLGMFTEKIDVSGKLTLEALVMAAIAEEQKSKKDEPK